VIPTPLTPSTSVPLLLSRLAELAHADPDHVAVVEGDVRLSRRELAAQVEAAARGMRASGLLPGDRIAIDLPNGIAWVVAALAAVQAGLTIVPLDPGLNYHELKYQLRHAEVAGAIIPESGGAFDYLELFDDMLPHLPELRLVVYVGPGTSWFDNRAIPFRELLVRGERHGPLEPAVPTTVAPLALVYTSGTMGKPKGVILSQSAMVGCAEAIREALPLEADERILLAVPLHHVFGLSALLVGLLHGAKVVLLADFTPAAALRAIASEQITHFPGVPTMFEMMMRAPEFADTDLVSLRSGVVAGSTVLPALADRIRRWCDVEVLYGLTEGGPVISLTRPDDSPERRRATVGRPLAGVEARVVDLRSGELHALEAVGELAIASPWLMVGYHRMPQETARVLTSGGYLLTGDLAVVDEEGYITLVARRKEIILRAGQAVTPREIEDVLRTHPGIDDACVLGLPHDVLGEVICACVVPVEGAVVTGPELMRFCQDMLAATKVPDLVRFFDDFPRTASGKIRRQDVARMVVE